MDGFFMSHWMRHKVHAMRLCLPGPFIDDAGGFHFKSRQRLSRKLDSNPKPKPVGGFTSDGFYDLLSIVAGHLDKDQEFIHCVDIVNDHSKFLDALE
jgi:hypothetical protein